MEFKLHKIKIMFCVYCGHESNLPYDNSEHQQLSHITVLKKSLLKQVSYDPLTALSRHHTVSSDCIVECLVRKLFHGHASSIRKEASSVQLAL